MALIDLAQKFIRIKIVVEDGATPIVHHALPGQHFDLAKSGKNVSVTVKKDAATVSKFTITGWHMLTLKPSDGYEHDVFANRW